MVVRCWAAFSALLLFSRASEAAVATCDGESDPFADPSASSGCGCSGTSGGLKRDTVLGSTTSSSSGSSSSSIDSRGGGDGDSSTPSRRLAEEADISSSSSVASLRERNLDSMVYIEGGTFYMGTDHPLIKVLFVLRCPFLLHSSLLVTHVQTDGEGPRRLVTLSDFMIDKYEVGARVCIYSVVNHPSALVHRLAVLPPLFPCVLYPAPCALRPVVSGVERGVPGVRAVHGVPHRVRGLRLVLRLRKRRPASAEGTVAPPNVAPRLRLILDAVSRNGICIFLPVTLT